MKTIFEIVAVLCRLLQALLMEGGLVETILENVGLQWRMQSILLEGGW